MQFILYLDYRLEFYTNNLGGNRVDEKLRLGA
jgi:hypothetical protein